tara:strand:+ start:682 stop:1590 length:909 start_codon:yes stop_codon:yes gene_type:complete
MGLITKNNEQYYLGPDGVWNSLDENYGNYQFTPIKDIISNFMVAYVGQDKLITKIKRTDVAFHAQRGLQELHFDTLPSERSIEIEIGPLLNFILPQDYVNYIKLTWTDVNGIERIIYPTRNTSDPLPYLQDHNYEYIFDEQNREIVKANPSETLKRFKRDSQRADIYENANNADLLSENAMGRRYGLTPENAQSNGVFYIDQIKGIIHFSSDICHKIVTLKYISDGLAYDEDMKIHKLAEEALYKYIAYAIVSTRPSIPEYIVGRLKKEAFSSKRNAKLRLSNIKIEEIAQVMRNKSKQIKH